MSLCAGIRADGARCKAQATRSSSFCIGHDPDRADARRRRASKGGKRGGRGRPQAELADIKRRLLELTESVLDGTQNRASAAVAGQLLNTLIRCCGLELKVREVDELDARLQELEGLLDRQGERGGYGRT
jgi:hypothetical protein